MPTRIVKLEIVELDREHRALLRGVGEELRRGVNRWWRLWEAWHTERDSSAAIVAEIEADRAWKAADKGTRGERPKPAVSPIPNELNRLLGTETAKRCPQVNSRVVTLTVNKLGKTLRTKQSTAAACKWWRAILLDLDSRGTARHAQPIPLDGANCKVEPIDERGRVRLSFRADRIARAGRASSTLIECKLKTDGKRAAYAQPARDIAAGLAPLKQATLVFDSRVNKWFAMLTYQAASRQAEVDPERTAVLRPGAKRSWRLRLPGGRTVALGGRGHHVAHVRNSLLLQRWGRQHSYAFAPKRKGAGRERALEPLFKLTARWNNFTRSANDAVTATLANILADEGCGRLVLLTGDGTRLLAKAGKIDDREDSTGWPWYQFEQLCEQKLSRLSVKVDVKPLLRTRTARKAAAAKKIGSVG